MEFDDNTFDGGYSFEATCYARDPVHVYREIMRVLKPGAIFVDSAWAMTDKFDLHNPEHVEIKEGIEVSENESIDTMWSDSRKFPFHGGLNVS